LSFCITEDRESSILVGGGPSTDYP